MTAVKPIILSGADPRENVKAITAEIEAGVKEVFNGDDWQNYLATMAKFHRYSFNNVLLIHRQLPGASFVAGYRKWQAEFDRHVKRGEKGIKILAAVIKKDTVKTAKTQDGKPVLDDEGKQVYDDEEIKRVYFRVVSVFDISQTEGKDLPSLGIKELTGEVEDYEKLFRVLEKVSPVPITFEPIESGAKGYFSPQEQRIVIDMSNEEVAAVKTAIHEIAHALLHDPTKDGAGMDKDRFTKETEAESIAYTVCRHFGIDTSQYSFVYLASWAKDQELTDLKEALETIQKTAAKVIDEIESGWAELTREEEKEIGEELSGERSFEIWQLKRDIPEGREMRFEGYDYIEQQGIEPDESMYDLVYTGIMQEDETLNDIYERFNVDQPADFDGHALSVSDVVTVHDVNKQTSSYYVDRRGFKRLPKPITRRQSPVVREVSVEVEVREKPDENYHMNEVEVQEPEVSAG